MSSAEIEALIFVGEFLYALTHNHPWGAVFMAVSLVVMGRGRSLLRIILGIMPVALLLDALTGHPQEDLR